MLNPVTFLEGVTGLVENVISFLNPTSDDFAFNGILNFLKFLDPTSIGSPFGKLADLALDTRNIFEALNPLSDKFIITRLVNDLIDGIKGLFVPSEERINAITNIVKGKFEFIDSIKIGVNALDDTINNLGNSPRLTMTLGPTKYTEEQRVVVLDLSWYAPFKPYGDLVLTGFIYLFFLWRIFISIPNIVNGLGGAIQADVMISDIQNGFRTGEMKTKGGWFRR